MSSRTQLDLPMDAAQWQRNFDFVNGPRARACSVLGALHLGPDGFHHGPYLGRGTRDEQRPYVIFHGPRVGDTRWARWVIASDLLALSLLQARLIDLELPIKIEQWSDRQLPPFNLGTLVQTWRITAGLARRSAV